MFQTKFNSETLLWTGPERSVVYDSNVTIGKIILKALDGPSRVIQISDNNGLHVTNQDIRQKSIRVAQNLLKMGIGKNKVLGFFTRNSSYLAPVVFGSLFIGAPVNPLDPSYKKDEIVHMFKLTTPSMIFVDSDAIERLEEALLELNLSVPIFVFGDDHKHHRSVEELFEETGIESEFTPPDIGDPKKQIAVIVCSSGTTGYSKGVSLSNSAMLYNMNVLDLMQDTKILCFSSLYWISGLLSLVAGTLGKSIRIITTNDFTPELMLEMIEKYQVTETFTPPSSIAMTLKCPKIWETNLSSLQTWWSGGSFVHNEIIEKMNKHLPNGEVYIGYGMTEIAGGIAIDFPHIKAHTVGQLAPGVSIKIVDDNGNRVGPGIDGEICFDSEYKFLGYYGNEDATKSMFDDDGYVMSGDIGHFDEDGCLFLVDRKKDILKYKNRQISPSEIESVIMKHDGVKMVSVVGVPDVECTDLPAAVIIKSENSDVTSSEIGEMVRSKLNDAKQLRGGIYFMDSLPMTPSGKVLRRKVKEIVMDLYKKSQSLASIAAS